MNVKGAISFGALLVVSAACTRAEHQAQSVRRAVSPLVGAWEINADAAGKSPREGYPQFTVLRFGAGGTLLAAYAASPGGIGALTGAKSATKNETDRWSVSGSALRIVEGSRELAFRYEVRDGQLLLTPSGASSAVVYAKKTEPASP